MKNLLMLMCARAVLMLPEPDAAGGAPAAEGETNTPPSETNPPISETAAPDVNDQAGLDSIESEDAFMARRAAEREEAARIRALIPVQEVELRPCVGAAHLGVIIGSGEPGGGYRCIPLADWRTDRLQLRAGDSCQIVVLAGEGQRQWDYYVEQERRAKEQPPLGADVKTTSLSPAAAAAVLGAAGAAPAVDPLEATQDVEKVPTGEGLPNTSATPEPATGP